MSRREDDFGPVIGPGARRDPGLSIARDDYNDQMRQYQAAEHAMRRDRDITWLILLLLPAGLVIVGIAAHLAWDGIMVGWGIV